MADRFFSQEGLRTSANRDADANRIVSSINGVQNRLMQLLDSESASDPEVLYAPVVRLVRDLTQKASQEGDTDWLKDMEEVLRFVVPIYGLGHFKAELQRMLLSALRSSWEQAEAARGRRRTVSQRIGSAVGDFAERIGGALQNLGKKLKS